MSFLLNKINIFKILIFRVRDFSKIRTENNFIFTFPALSPTLNHSQIQQGFQNSNQFPNHSHWQILKLTRRSKLKALLVHCKFILAEVCSIPDMNKLNHLIQSQVMTRLTSSSIPENGSEVHEPKDLDIPIAFRKGARNRIKHLTYLFRSYRNLSHKHKVFLSSLNTIIVPKTLSEALGGKKWVTMKVEMEALFLKKKNWDLVKLLKGKKQLGADGYTQLGTIQMALQNGIRQGWLPRDTLRHTISII